MRQRRVKMRLGAVIELVTEGTGHTDPISFINFSLPPNLRSQRANVCRCIRCVERLLPKDFSDRHGMSAGARQALALLHHDVNEASSAIEHTVVRWRAEAYDLGKIRLDLQQHPRLQHTVCVDRRPRIARIFRVENDP